TDVDGVYTTDPRIVKQARKIDKISFEEMLELASLGAKVLQTRSVELAMARGVRLRVLSSFVKDGAPNEGTLVVDEEEIMEKQIVSGVAYSRDDAKVTLLGVESTPGRAARIFTALAEANINVDMIVQSDSREKDAANILFSCKQVDVDRTVAALEALRGEVKFDQIVTDDNVAMVSVVGLGMKSHAGVAGVMFRALAEKGVNIQAISTSEIKISVLVESEYTELAVRALHAAYGLDVAAA
ncbi:MAG: aspartate kinase, partial [Pseudomonadota bacterium]